MEGRIDNVGNLEIKRKNEYNSQWCPLCGAGLPKKCGHDCPLFGEPEQIGSAYIEGADLTLYHKTLEFEKFEDLRV